MNRRSSQRSFSGSAGSGQTGGTVRQNLWLRTPNAGSVGIQPAGAPFDTNSMPTEALEPHSTPERSVRRATPMRSASASMPGHPRRPPLPHDSSPTTMSSCLRKPGHPIVHLSVSRLQTIRARWHNVRPPGKRLRFQRQSGRRLWRRIHGGVWRRAC